MPSAYLSKERSCVTGLCIYVSDVTSPLSVVKERSSPGTYPGLQVLIRAHQNLTSWQNCNW